MQRKVGDGVEEVCSHRPSAGLVYTHTSRERVGDEQYLPKEPQHGHGNEANNGKTLVKGLLPGPGDGGAAWKRSVLRVVILIEAPTYPFRQPREEEALTLRTVGGDKKPTVFARYQRGENLSLGMSSCQPSLV